MWRDDGRLAEPRAFRKALAERRPIGDKKDPFLRQNQGVKMGLIESRLVSMGLSLPATHPYPSPNRTAAVRVGNILFLSGHGTGRQEMSLGIKQNGTGGGDVTDAQAQRAARATARALHGVAVGAIGEHRAVHAG